MTRRGIGWALVVAGVASVMTGALALLAGDTPTDVAAVDTTIPAPAETTTTTSRPSTTSTTLATTTSTITIVTTSTIPAETVEHFIAAFAAAVETDDVDFLYDRLHPAVIETQGEELCRSWIAEEIVALGEYRLTGEPTGPVRQTMQTPEGEREIDVISAPVSFTFQGETFDTTAGLSLTNGVMYWLGECR